MPRSYLRTTACGSIIFHRHRDPQSSSRRYFLLNHINIRKLFVCNTSTNESHESENVTGCHAARNKCQVVMIVGPAGAGKFTLANKILDRPDYDLFEERQDGAGVTTKIKEGKSDIVMNVCMNMTVFQNDRPRE